MKKDDILVVKLNVLIQDMDDYISDLHKYLLKSKETGVIVLPPFVDAIVVPGDVEIKVEEAGNYDDAKYI